MQFQKIICNTQKGKKLLVNSSAKMLKATTLDIDRRKESSVRALGVGGNVKLLNKKTREQKNSLFKKENVIT